MNDRDPDGQSEMEPEPPSGEFQILITGCTQALSADIQQALSIALRQQNIKKVELEVTVVDETEMCRQHERWLNDPTPTDVLTFDMSDGDDPESIEGQIIVCEAVARERAFERGHDWEDELLLYAIHGCLHLSGFDDHDEADFEKMHAEEDRILVLLGRPPIFAGASPHHDNQENGNAS